MVYKYVSRLWVTSILTEHQLTGVPQLKAQNAKVHETQKISSQQDCHVKNCIGCQKLLCPVIGYV